MASANTFEEEKLRTRRIIVTALLTVVTVTFLLLTETPAQAGGAPPAEGPSVQAAATQPPSDPIRPQEE